MLYSNLSEHDAILCNSDDHALAVAIRIQREKVKVFYKLDKVNI